MKQTDTFMSDSMMSQDRHILHEEIKAQIKSAEFSCRCSIACNIHHKATRFYAAHRLFSPEGEFAPMFESGTRTNTILTSALSQSLRFIPWLEASGGIPVVNFLSVHPADRPSKNRIDLLVIMGIVLVLKL